MCDGFAVLTHSGDVHTWFADEHTHEIGPQLVHNFELHDIQELYYTQNAFAARRKDGNVIT